MSGSFRSSEPSSNSPIAWLQLPRDSWSTPTKIRQKNVSRQRKFIAASPSFERHITRENIFPIIQEANMKHFVKKSILVGAVVCLLAVTSAPAMAVTDLHLKPRKDGTSGPCHQCLQLKPRKVEAIPGIGR